MNMLPLALRSLRREWHLPELRTLAASLVLAVVALGVVATLATRIERGMLASAAELIGGDFMRQLRRARVTAMLAPAIVLNHLARHDRESLASLRVLCSGGDVLLAETCRELWAGGFAGDLRNLYGPTEATVACSGHEVGELPADVSRVPIGRRLDGARLYVLDDDLAEVPAGAPRARISTSRSGTPRSFTARPTA